MNERSRKGVRCGACNLILLRVSTPQYSEMVTCAYRSEVWCQPNVIKVQIEAALPGAETKVTVNENRLLTMRPPFCCERWAG
jgi:phage FluMu protein Com